MTPYTPKPTDSPAVLWILSWHRDNGQQEHVRIENNPFRIGRHPENDLCISSPRVSGMHADLIVAGDSLILRDAESTNGTFVNGTCITTPTPLEANDLIQFADAEFRVSQRHACFQLEVEGTRATSHEEIKLAWSMSLFDQLLETNGIRALGQPIIDIRGPSPYIWGVESLARSEVDGLETAARMFATAERIDREVELSAICRDRAIEFARRLPTGCRVFVNTHPAEELLKDVLPSLFAWKEAQPDRTVVVEVHESAVTNPQLMATFAAAVREMGYEIAYDDFGEGQARLKELIAVPPDYIKFDAGLIRGLNREEDHQRNIVSALIRMISDAGVATIAEGVETEGEAEACQNLGFDFAQGYHFGRPQEI